MQKFMVEITETAQINVDVEADSKEEAEKFIKEVDKLCDDYAKRHTGVSRYDPRNYDLVINMEGKTEDEAVDLILQYIG